MQSSAMPTTAPTSGASSALLALDTRDLDLLTDALDSHVYWELSDREYRSGGSVHGPGAFDAENVELIARARALADRLARQRQTLAELVGESRG
jgi:hypothetical protein